MVQVKYMYVIDGIYLMYVDVVFFFVVLVLVMKGKLRKLGMGCDAKLTLISMYCTPYCMYIICVGSPYVLFMYFRIVIYFNSFIFIFIFSFSFLLGLGIKSV